MIIEIKQNDKIHEIIEVKNAYILGINIINKTERTRKHYTDELQFDKPYIHFDRLLPNGYYMDLLLIKANEDTWSRYKGIDNLSIKFDCVTVESKL